MVAYSFKERFVLPIKAGLGLVVSQHAGEIDRPIYPKRQTIRANGKRRHARPGETLQLYRAMRTKQCFLIGTAVCRETQPIWIEVELPRIIIGHVKQRVILLSKVGALDDFARRDGTTTPP